MLAALARCHPVLLNIKLVNYSQMGGLVAPIEILVVEPQLCSGA